jgi:hypothetical protein
VTAGAAGFLTLIQQSARPERYGDPRRFVQSPVAGAWLSTAA